MAEQVQSGPQQSRARRFLGAGKRTLDGEDRSERIKTGRKGTPFRAFSPTIKPEFPFCVPVITTKCSRVTDNGALDGVKGQNCTGPPLKMTAWLWLGMCGLPRARLRETHANHRHPLWRSRCTASA